MTLFLDDRPVRVCASTARDKSAKLNWREWLRVTATILRCLSECYLKVSEPGKVGAVILRKLTPQNHVLTSISLLKLYIDNSNHSADAIPFQTKLNDVIHEAI